ncbi:MAG: DNA polymerase III subunit alpha [Candidatus Brocadiia bacterium]
MKRSNFVHLHNHSHYSLLDGANTVEAMVEEAVRQNAPAVALTDHGNLFGAIEFYQMASSRGIKPIIGYEAYVAPIKRTDRQANGPLKERAYHLTLLAKNEKGYLNLIKLATSAYLEGFYYKPRIDKELLARYKDGLICLSGCLHSELSMFLSAGKITEALAVAYFYQELFKDDYYLELHNHNMPEQAKVVKGQLEIHKKTGAPMVVTNDVHYIKKSDARTHDILLCISTNKAYDDPARMRMSSNELYFKSESEMAKLFPEIPEAVANTLAIAERCNLFLNFSERHLPKFNVPDDKKSLVYLRELAEKYLPLRYPAVTDQIKQRLDYELGIIEKKGFADYFLVVWDFVRFAREQKIPVGPGRGSAAGSILSYALEITDIDPLKYGLIFERFLNPGRNEMPDIDIDFSQAGRDTIINYVRTRYGQENVAQLITFGTMKARLVIRDVGRVLGIPLIEVDRIAKKIQGQTLYESINLDPELKELYNSPPNSKIKELFDLSLKMEGLVRHASTHAAGVVIADKPLINYVPLYISDSSSTTQYPMDALQKIGLLKVDLLGIVTLDVIEKCLEIIQQTRNKSVDPRTISLNDKKTFDLLGQGETRGVFQLESAGMRDLAQKMKPDCFEDIIALVALYRPGPLQSGMVDQYIRCKHKLEPISYIHPSLEPILKETNGVVLYQEQVMLIANQLGGLSLTEADDLRKAMGKKLPEIMDNYEKQFIDGAVKNGITNDIARRIFELLKFFGGYGFNKSHSTAYAFTAYRTAYLKANYPAEFLSALMSCHRGVTDKIVEYVEESKRMGIKVLPPDINRSQFDFNVESGQIRFGLGAVKNVGDKAARQIIQARADKPFKSFYDFCERVDLRMVDKSVIDSLIKCGAMDGLGYRRSVLISGLDQVLSISSQRQHDRRAGQLNIMGRKPDDKVSFPPLPDVPDLSQEEILRFEKEMLGFYVSGHPLAKYQDVLSRLSTAPVNKLAAMPDNSDVKIGGIISTIRRGGGKGKGKSDKSIDERPVYFRLHDMSGSIESVIYPKEYKTFRPLINEGQIAFIRGRLNLKRTTEPLLRINDVVTIDQASEKMCSSIYINLNTTALADDIIQGLKDIFLAHPGTCPTFINLVTGENKKVILKTNTDYSVTPSKQFMEDIQDLLGVGHVELR